MRISSKVTCLFVACMMLWGSAHFACADLMLEMEAYFAGEESVSGLVKVPPRDEIFRYYAQNDSLWGSLVYEAEGNAKNRPFRDSGCNPAAFAMALAKLLPDETLSVISEYARYPFSLCICSLNKGKCNRHSLRYMITSERDYVRFLPLILGDFATGNNIYHTQSRSAAAGTGTGYMQRVCSIYGLDFQISGAYKDAQEALADERKAVVALAGSGGCFTTTGHYVFLASMDEERLYVLDPLCRSEYKTKRAGKLNIITPGIVSISHADIGSAYFQHYVIVSLPGETE